MKSMNKWVLAIIYFFVLTLILHLSFKMLILTAMDPTGFPTSRFLIGLLTLVCGGCLLGFGARKYIFSSSNIKSEQWNVAAKFTLLTTLSCFTAMLIFYWV
ncbi:hypothetical protein [Bacillus cereus group sp. BfR-BA-01312]|uniref:hypothetical protein n=1 Tax=Bacillus cereus group sp. BfR-BA-01312 TaxID=2920289 RepID=UPI001F59C28C|nr:hypothetical protein [Bacillus cereus group sp. BfR-BA-01312]